MDRLTDRHILCMDRQTDRYRSYYMNIQAYIIQGYTLYIQTDIVHIWIDRPISYMDRHTDRHRSYIYG